jgi:hypothetical protein
MQQIIVAYINDKKTTNTERLLLTVGDSNVWAMRNTNNLYNGSGSETDKMVRNS